MTIIEALERHARERGDHPALEAKSGAISYRELSRLARVAAGRLARAGMRTGEPVVVQRGDGVPTLAAMLGLAWHGAPIVFPGEERPLDEIPGRPARFEIVPRGGAAGGARQALVLEELLAPGRSPPAPPRPSPADAVLLMGTSGTTGAPKTFCMTHAQVLARCRQLEQSFGLGSHTRTLLYPTLRSAVGRRMALNVLTLGGTLVLVGSTLREEMVALMRTKRIDFALVTPVHLEDFVKGDLPEPALPETVIGVTSAPLSDELHQRVRKKLSPRLHDVYGTNETGILTVAGPGDRLARPGTVGRAPEGVELQVIGADGRPLEPGQVGEIRSRAEGYPAGYLGLADEQGRCFRDGWFHPGDLGLLDADGFLFLRGRTDDVINNQGLKFYPVEIETVLRQHPGVADVVVVGIDSGRYNQVPVALVVTRDARVLGELQDFFRARRPRTMIPRWFFRVKSLERTAAGKLPREAVRRRALEMIAAVKKKG